MRYSWLLAAAALAGCSENSAGDGPTAPPPMIEAMAPSETAAMAAARESQQVPAGPARCSAAPTGGTGMDILGVRLGMDVTTARRVLQCEGYAVNIQRKTAMSDGSSAVSKMTGQRGNDRFDIHMAGLPGRERIVGMLRHIEYFTDGTEPAVEAVRSSLLEKYGPLEALYHGGRGKPILQGVRLSSYAKEPYMVTAEQDCASDVAAHGGSLYYPKPHCGELVAIYIIPKDGNPGLVRELTVEITDGTMAAGLDREYARFAEGDRARAAEREISNAKARTPEL